MTHFFYRYFDILFKLLLLVEGYTIVGSSKVYGSIGEDVLIPSPKVEVDDIQWSFLGTKEVLATCTNGLHKTNVKSNKSNRLNITANCSLQITYLTKDDVGIYKWFQFARDDSSKHTYEIEIELRKEPHVSIVVFPSPNVESGQTINMSCLQKSITKVHVDKISWYHNEKELPNTTNNILIENVTYKHAGKYECIAENTAGKSDAVVQITINSHPNKPTDIKWFTDKSPIYLEWKAGYDGGSKQTFVVQYRKTTNGKLQFVEVESSNETIQGCFLDNLEPHTEYKLSMYAFNNIGNSTSTKEQTIFTTGNHHLVIQSCSWEIGVISSAAVVVFLLCLCGMKGFQFTCRSSRPQSNVTTSETRETQYDEIDSMYINASDVNGRHQLMLNNTANDSLPLSSINRNICNITTENVESGSFNDEIIQSYTNANNVRADIISTRSSSQDSYLDPSRNYINLAIGFTNEHSHQIGEQEFLGDSSSSSNSESSETYIKSANQYETVTTTNIVEHSYESTTEAY